jgi:hypothetical protein
MNDVLSTWPKNSCSYRSSRRDPLIIDFGKRRKAAFTAMINIAKISTDVRSYDSTAKFERLKSVDMV